MKSMVVVGIILGAVSTLLSDVLTFGDRQELVAPFKEILTLSPNGYSSPYLYDYDGDGLLDLLVGVKENVFNDDGALNSCWGRVRVYLNKGSATKPYFPEFAYLTKNGEVIAEEQDASNPFACLGLTVAFCDFNGDGYRDLVLGHLFGELEVYLGDGTADGCLGTIVLLTKDTAPGNRSHPCPYDIDGDGKEELVVGYMSGGFQVFKYGVEEPVWVTDATGAAINIPTQNYQNNFRTGPTFADVNGDGLDDLVSGGTDGGVYVFPARSRGVWGSSPIQIVDNADQFPKADEYTFQPPRSRVSLGDLDGDRVPDIVIGYADGSVVWMRGGADKPVARPPIAVTYSDTGAYVFEGDTIECYVGQALSFNVLADTGSKVTVKGLPSGVKFKKNGKESHAGGVLGTVKAATKPGKGLVTITAKNPQTKEAKTLTFTILVRDLPAWAIGKFDGYALVNGATGTVSVTIAKNAIVSGKIQVGKKRYSFLGKSYSSVSENEGVPAFTYLSTVKVDGKVQSFGFVLSSSQYMDIEMSPDGIARSGGRIDATSQNPIGVYAMQNLWLRRDAAVYQLPEFAATTMKKLTVKRGELTITFGKKGMLKVVAIIDGQKKTVKPQLVMESYAEPACGCSAEASNGGFVISLPKVDYVTFVTVTVSAGDGQRMASDIDLDCPDIR